MLTDEFFPSPAPLPAEAEHFRFGTLTRSVEEKVVGRISGRLNAFLGIGTPALLQGVARATCFQGEVFLIHPSDGVLGMAMDESLGERSVNVDVRRARLDKLPAADGTFDTVFVVLQLHHEAHPAAVLAEAGRILEPSGRIVLLETVGTGTHSVASASPADAISILQGWGSSAGLTTIATELERAGFHVRNGDVQSDYDILLLELRATPNRADSPHPPSNLGRGLAIPSLGFGP